MVPRKTTSEGVPPPPTTPGEGQVAFGTGDHSFTLQAILQMQTTLGGLSTKVERLISDVAGAGTKLDTVCHQVTFVKGALWVIGGVIALAGILVGLYLHGNFTITLSPGR
jgi:hypothetical protein